MALISYIPPKCFDIFPPVWGMLRRSRCVHIFHSIRRGPKSNTVERKIRTHLDFLSIHQSGARNVKTFRWNHSRLQRQINPLSSWHSIGFPSVSNIGSTVSCRGETHRYTVLHINRHAGTPNKTKIKDTMSLDYSSVCSGGSRVVWVSMKEIYM